MSEEWGSESLSYRQDFVDHLACLLKINSGDVCKVFEIEWPTFKITDNDPVHLIWLISKSRSLLYYDR